MQMWAMFIRIFHKAVSVCKVCFQTFSKNKTNQISLISITSEVPVENVPVRIGQIAWPPVLMLAAFSRTAHPNNFTLDTALPWVLRNTPAKCEVDRMNGCRDNRRTDRQIDRHFS